MSKDLIRDLDELPLEPEPRRLRPSWVTAAAGLAGLTIITLLAVSRDHQTTSPATSAIPPLTTTSTTMPLLTAGYPEPRYLAAMAFDSVNQRSLLIGGVEISPRAGRPPGAPLGEVWAYDSTTRGWSSYPSDELAGRAGHAVAFDPAAGAVIVFGGTRQSISTCGTTGLCAVDQLGDTLRFDVGSGSWETLSPENSPSARYGASMAYDDGSGVMVLFGGATRPGSGFSNVPLDDTWLFDPATRSWTELSPSVSPPARAWHSMTYDVASDRILLVGGASLDGGLATDVWAFDVESVSWEQIAAPGPGPRWTAAVGIDDGRLVVAGGQGIVIRDLGVGTATEIRLLGDVWSLDLASGRWEEMQPFDGILFWTAATRDALSDSLLMLLHQATASYDAASDTWEMFGPDDAG